MIKYLDKKLGTFFGIDMTFKIIPRIFRQYKLMTIYCIDDKKGITILAALILLKYSDTNSLKKIFSILSALYNFSPICVTTDFDLAQMKALKETETFNKTPYIVCCLFHYAQAINVIFIF